MAKTWTVSINENERLELERIILDEDLGGAFNFLRDVVYSAIAEIEKPRSCYQDVDKTIDGVGRNIRKHKNLGTFNK